jgi:hypothetical protein
MEYIVIRKVKERGQFEYRLSNPEERRPLQGLLDPTELTQILTLPKSG